MRHYHKAKNNLHCPIVNLDKIWSLVGEEVRPCRQPYLQTCQKDRGCGSEVGSRVEALDI